MKKSKKDPSSFEELKKAFSRRENLKEKQGFFFWILKGIVRKWDSITGFNQLEKPEFLP